MNQWHDADMDALVWAEAWQVQAEMLPFAVGQTVTWPVNSQFNERVLAEHVGADTAAQISMGVRYDAMPPEDTAEYTGFVSHIEVYRCRLARGHVVPGSIETFPVLEVDGWESEEDAVSVSGYLVTLTNIRQAVVR